MRTISLVLLCALCGVAAAAKEKPAVQYRIPLPPKPDFTPLEWLLGDWEGKTTGPRASGDLHWSVNLDLENQVMIFRGEVALPATEGAPAWKEAWIGVLSSDRQGNGFLLHTFSTSGFFLRYRVTVDGPELRLTQEGGDQPPRDWLFRRELNRTGVDEFTETVQAAPPGKPFFDYYTAKLTRVKPPATSPEKPEEKPVEKPAEKPAEKPGAPATPQE